MLRKLDHNSPLPKYYQICDSIREKIEQGKFPVGSRIPTCRELMEYFGTTVVTVSSAMRQLENDGYINKVQGKGMFVAPPSAGKTFLPGAIKKVGLTMHARGDLFQNLTEALINDLEKHDIYTVPQSPVLPELDVKLAEKEKCLKKYIANGIERLVMDGTRYMPYKLLYKYRRDFRQLNFLMHYESGLDFPDANVITFDYVQAGRLAAKHLLKAGRKKFVFITFDKFSEARRKRNGCRSDDEGHDMIILSGMKAVLQEAGIPDSNLTVIREAAPADEELNMAKISELLRRDPLGIFAMADVRTIQIYKLAIRMGLDFKRNFSIVGLYNTSWTDVLHPPLTSISINEAEIAHLAADCIVNHKTGQRIVVGPRLVVRET